MDIVFIGGGRLATQFAQALRRQGHSISAVYSRTLAHAEVLARLLGALATDSVDGLPRQADAFILAVKDAAIAELLPQLCKGREGQAFFHTSGSVPMSVFGGHENCGVIYPMQTFSKERRVDFSNVPIFIEGSNERACQLAADIALTVSSHVESRNSEERRILHLAAVFACNFANHCYALSAKVLEQAGMSFDVMLPLIDETAAKVHDMPPRDAQTGPAVRYDEGVIEAHLKLLQDDPVTYDVYKCLSQSIYSHNR